MARYTGPVCKLCRREGEKLFLKGERCYTQKCAMERRAYPPGQHGRSTQWGRNQTSDFGAQLRAKQKARRVYGVLERQFRRYYKQAIKNRGLTGLTLLQILESRLDNVIYRMGFASSRAQARQMVTHGHFVVNGHRTDVPSMQIKEGDKIEIREGSKSKTLFKDLVAVAEERTIPEWISRDVKKFNGEITRLPERSEIDANLNEQLIVEFYSR
ncbi:MAG: 30S ribosomal protein S4 [Chloroflexi bacterium]|jgi:small subunit ribosomal protein S4|nr:30S ribosomal protein S4 [Chloroflexota bacterium]MBT3669332.1 30S ribosomal protein S4 [Chloroflexota bacterium]MBT4003469.1 30S ribosomal protein S4 [Chloroflexota bacterium]MBT4306039.1 30S ribosomal protein S4 [Chloroflexota bacterium]MBT4532683.1 30S ribosomal protein S4 [Chloroflexota bacterium]